ncbi:MULTISPECIES: peptidase T [Anaerococcus]|jgi:peptidase T|uniref:Peptidase T n=1 Tax=Anaerococcus octavius TaxID=54007 RepID=A0A2I1MA56_9FIRM|nr:MULTISPECIES: peptidase T [Anaerococcus]MDU2599208.1 peptidase T [Anaerococcus sp.]PKZ16959.1 peptidase T [Anaerococcus octavius]SUU92282.1 Peptidase T [Anaerococcus octavius]
MDNITKRFLNYITFDTQSDPENGDEQKPSSEGQWVLAKELKKELEELGLTVTINDEAFVFSEIKANTDKDLPKVGFIAHMDTSPEMPGKIDDPQIIDYKGGDIKLNDKRSITVEDFPVLKDLEGLTLITTRGETLLGADDKSGVAAIMNMAEYFVNNPEVEHGDIKIAFTPDEEIGTGADTFDVENFGADFAYTIDGGYIGELEYETFNGAAGKVNIKGKSVHPGSAKNTMINSTTVAFEFDRLLGEVNRPEHTEGYEGFYHLTNIKGDIENTKMEYIIRHHDREEFENMKKQFMANKDYLNNKYGNIIEVEIKDSYYNMGEVLKDKPEIVGYAKKAMENLDIEPLISPIRGGTDGSKLSFMGLPCPNIFAGGLNFHGVYEILPIEFLQKSSETIIEIVKVIAKDC